MTSMRLPVSPKRILVAVALVGAVLALSGSGFYLGYRLGEEAPKIVLVHGVSNIEKGKAADVDFNLFWEAWELINENYLKDKEVSASDKVYGAIRGLVGSLDDPNSVFYTPEDNRLFQDDIRGSFGGIGAELGLRKGQILIIAPLKGTPAERAGLKAGDQILKVNATSTEGFTVEQAVKIIRGPEGTDVTLTIFREGWEKSKEFTITRSTIIVPTVDFEMRENVAYIQLHSFNANASRHFYDAIVKAATENAEGVVLDLRNNPGGYLEVAVDLAGWFLPQGTLVVSESGRDGIIEKFEAQGNAALAELPVVVLVNQGSASASEILAGALRDQRNVKLIGEQTFGKGTVQQIHSLRDKSSVKLTWAQWVLPNGHILEGTGLKPDIEVKITDEDTEEKRDPQLEKALEILKSEISKSTSNV